MSTAANFQHTFSFSVEFSSLEAVVGFSQSLVFTTKKSIFIHKLTKELLYYSHLQYLEN